MTTKKETKGVPLVCDECGRVVHQGTSIRCIVCNQVFHHLCWERIGEHGLLVGEPCPEPEKGEDG